MSSYIKKEDKYLRILETICEIRGINKNELFKVLKDKECKYLFFLLLKKYRCTDVNEFYKDFSIDNKKIINYNIKKAEEKFFINKEFRDMYFEAEEMIDNAVK